jgi:two-component system nitrate/nitrite response regulator NarL
VTAELIAERRRPVRVVVVDDHEVFRNGLMSLLTDQGLDIVGDAGNGQEALEVVARVAPDVVVMDLNLPGMSGLEAIARLAAESPAARVLVLTISADERDVTEAILAGACGYVLKDASIDEIVAGVRAAAAGDSLISPKVATALLEQIRSGAADEPQAELSERECDVLRLVAEGKDNSEIAERLFISPQTVKNHISNILAKLQMENRIQAAVYAVRQGIV